jgi:hypothetical protein
MTLNEHIDTIKTREDFIAFVAQLRADWEERKDEWENPTLDLYLHALGAWVGDMDGYYKNTGKPAPKEIDWQFIASVLMAASIYE